MPDDTFTFEEAAQSDTFTWDDVAPETPSQALRKQQSRLSLEQEAADLEPVTEPPAAVPDFPPLPPFAEAQLPGDTPDSSSPGLLVSAITRFNRLGRPTGTPTVPEVPPYNPAELAKIEDLSGRIELSERVKDVTDPGIIGWRGVRRSAVTGVEALTSNTGLVLAAGAVIAPEVVLPAIFATTASQVPGTLNRIQQAREQGDRAAYYEGIGELLQEGAVMGGTGGPIVRLPRALRAAGEASRANEALRFSQARDITPRPPRLIADRLTEPPAPGAPTAPQPTAPAGGPSALENRPSATLHEPVPAQPVSGQEAVPTQVSGAGVSTPQEAAAQVPLTPADALRAKVARDEPVTAADVDAALRGETVPAAALATREAAFRELRMEGVTAPDAEALLNGSKTVKEVVEGNFKVTPTFVPKPGDVDPRGGHAEAWMEGYNQAIERLTAIVSQVRPAAPVPSKPAPLTPAEQAAARAQLIEEQPGIATREEPAARAEAPPATQPAAEAPKPAPAAQTTPAPEAKPATTPARTTRKTVEEVITDPVDETGVTYKQYNQGQRELDEHINEFSRKFGIKEVDDHVAELVDDVLARMPDSPLKKEIVDEIKKGPDRVVSIITAPWNEAALKELTGWDPEIAVQLAKYKGNFTDNARLHVTHELNREHGLIAEEIRDIFNDYRNTGRKRLYDLDPGLAYFYDVYGEAYLGSAPPHTLSMFPQRSEAHGLGEPSMPPTVEDVRRQRLVDREGTPVAGESAPPPITLDVAVDASTKPDATVARRAKDFNIFNNVNSGQWTFYFGKLGAAAKSAWEKMALSGFKMREDIGRDVAQYVDGLLASLPRPVRRKGGTAFFDVLDGKDIATIESEWSGKPGGNAVIAGARALKTRLEEIRVTIRDTKRDAYNAFLMGLDRDTLAQLYDRNIPGARDTDTARFTKAQFADALTIADLPDNWGIADGTYLPHSFFGDWKITVRQGDNVQFVTRAKTVAEAKARVFEMTKANPALAEAQWKIEPDTVVPADVIRLGDRQFWRLVSQMKENLGVTSAEIKQAQQGVIGRRAAKQKWWGNLQQRRGFGGYSHDYGKVMRAYFAGHHRWLELSKLNREVQPLIEQVRQEGRPEAAQALTDILDHLWGKPARSTVLFDNFVRQIPGLRDYVKPMLLDRVSQNVRKAVAYGTLSTARFALVNRLQPLQGLYPLVGERILAQAKILQHTAEGRALLDRAGVRFDPGQYGETGGIKGAATALRERFTGERSNQELAFLAMYQHGIESGLGDAAAINYAKLRGQLLTQFTPNPADTPPALRGPFAGLAFQFKRFPLKQGELLWKMGAAGNVAGLARWFAVMAATGGLSYFMRQLFVRADKRERLRRSIEQEHGTSMANAAMYMLPAAINVDLSGSLVLGDEPFGSNFYERLGRRITGPAVSLTYETGKALGTAAREPMSTPQQFVTQMRRIPALRQIAEVVTLLQGDYDVRTPDGEVKYRKSVRDALMGVGAFRTANEANMQSAVNAIVELKKQESDLKNAAFVAVQGTPAAQEAAIDAIKEFNSRWPEVAITPSELTDYIRTRAKGLGKTDYERLAGNKFVPLLPQPAAP